MYRDREGSAGGTWCWEPPGVLPHLQLDDPLAGLQIRLQGLSQDEIGRIHHRPEGRGLFGQLIDDPRPLRLADIAAHSASSGFPDGHPPMSGFLGVPVRIRDEVFGSLYLTNKRDGGDITEDDEAVLVALGVAAAVAVENARLYESARR